LKDKQIVFFFLRIIPKKVFIRRWSSFLFESIFRVAWWCRW